MKKLPMQKLIEKFNEIYGDTHPEHISNGIREGLSMAIKEAERLLPVEKAAIVEAFNADSVECDHFDEHIWAYKDAEEYFKKTYE